MDNLDTLPKLSVVIVVRNAVNTIARALDSVIAQHYPNLELIVWDGLSNDGTAEVLARYSHIITTLKTEKDNGPPDASNHAIALASGDYIGSLNADDEYVPGALWAVADKIIKEPKPDVISFGMLYRNQGKIIGYYADASQLELSLDKVFCELPTFMLSRFIKRDLLRSLLPINTSYYYTNDRDLMGRLALLRPRNTIIAQAFYIFDVHPGSLSSNIAHYGIMVTEHVRMAQAMLLRDDLSEEERVFVKNWRLHRLVYGFWMVLARGEFLAALRFLKWGLEYGGWRWLVLCKYLFWAKLFKRIGMKLSNGIDRGTMRRNEIINAK